MLAELGERTCVCGRSYRTEIIAIFGARIPKAPRCPECYAREEEEREVRRLAAEREAAEREKAERLARDPDQLLWRFGFRDQELVGKDLRNFECPTRDHVVRLEIAKRFAGGQTDRPGLVLLGCPGRGKTHLARGIARSWVRQGKEFRYWKLQDIIAECKRKFRGGGETADDFIAWIGSFPGLVIIDELGRSRGDQWDTDCIVYPLADRRMARPTIWISNYNLANLAQKYDEAVVSRLMRCQVVAFPDSMVDFRAK